MKYDTIVNIGQTMRRESKFTNKFLPIIENRFWQILLQYNFIHNVFVHFAEELTSAKTVCL